MALGADYVQAAGGQHFFMLGFPAVFQIGNAAGFFFFAEALIGIDGMALMLHIATQHDIGAAAGHIGGHGNHARFAGLRHNQSLALVLFGIQHIVRQTLLIQQLGHQFGVFNAGGTHEHGLAGFMAALDIGHHGFVFFFGGAENLVVGVFALHRPIGGDNHGFEAVDALEFKRFGVGRAGHAGQLVI